MGDIGSTAALTAFVLVVCTVCIGMVIVWIAAPEKWMRFCVGFVLFWYTPAQRRWICKRFDRAAYYYLGTTGDSEKDAAIGGFDRIYGRGLGIVTVLAFLGMFVFAIVHSVVAE